LEDRVRCAGGDALLPQYGQAGRGKQNHDWRISSNISGSWSTEQYPAGFDKGGPAAAAAAGGGVRAVWTGARRLRMGILRCCQPMWGAGGCLTRVLAVLLLDEQTDEEVPVVEGAAICCAWGRGKATSHQLTILKIGSNQVGLI
jgi:hypothetical protein